MKPNSTRSSSLMDALRDFDPDAGPLVFGIHRRNDLRLVFDDPFDPIHANLLSPTDRVFEFADAAELLADVRALASTPGGILYVVYAYTRQSPPLWYFARDFGEQEAANVFAQVAVHEASRVEKLAERLRETTRDVAFGKAAR